MTRLASIVAVVIVAAPLLALTGCPEREQGFHPPASEPDDPAVIKAAKDQLTDGETKGWSPSDDKAFSARLAELSMPERLELGQRLAREISLGTIKLKAGPRNVNGRGTPGNKAPDVTGNPAQGPGMAPAGGKAGPDVRPPAK